MTYNLFIEHHTILQAQKGKAEIGTGWEDDFTNILSFYLSCDSKALDTFCRLVLGEDYEKPTSIETQVFTKYGRPDIVITLDSGSQLMLECKVDASLQTDQLQRYLDIEPVTDCNTYVALFSKNSLNIPPEVVQSDRYKSPPRRSHFFWTDLFRVLPRSETGEIGINTARYCFRNYLELVGFAPSSLNENWRRLYEDRTIGENRKVQKEFGRKLAPIRAWLTDQGFKVTAVSYSGLQAVPKSGCMLKAGIAFMVIAPARSRKDLLSLAAAQKLNNEVLRLAFVYNSPDVPEHALRVYKAFPCPLNDLHGNSWWPTKPYKFSRSRVRLEFVANLSPFLENETAIEMNIKDSCQKVIEFISAVIGDNTISTAQMTGA